MKVVSICSGRRVVTIRLAPCTPHLQWKAHNGDDTEWAKGSNDALSTMHALKTASVSNAKTSRKKQYFRRLSNDYS